jgi:hypothetical protein
MNQMVPSSSYILHIYNLRLFTITNYSPKYVHVITTEINLEFCEGRGSNTDRHECNYIRLPFRAASATL